MRLQWYWEEDDEIVTEGATGRREKKRWMGKDRKSAWMRVDDHAEAGRGLGPWIHNGKCVLSITCVPETTRDARMQEEIKQMRILLSLTLYANWKCISQNAPEKWNQWEVKRALYTEMFKEIDLHGVRGCQVWSLQGRPGASNPWARSRCCRLEVGFLFRENSTLLWKPFKWLDKAHPDYQT